MGERPITQEQRRWLLQEMEEWQRTGIVSATSGEQIIELYIPLGVAEEQKRGQAVYILMGVAALLAAIAVLLLIGFNWEALPGAVKLLLLFGILAAVYLGGWLLRFRKEENRLSEVAFFLGNLLFGANIWLVQQVFQVSASATVGLSWWAVGVVPFVLLLDTLLFHALFVSLIALWSLFSDNWFDTANTGVSSWLLPCLVILPIALLGLRQAHQHQRPGLIKLYLPLLIWWAILPLWHYNGWTLLPALGLFGAMLLFIAGQTVLGQSIRSIYRSYGSLLTGVVLLPLGYYGLITESLAKKGEQQNVWGAAVVLALSIACLVYGVTQYRQNTSSEGTIRQDRLPMLLALFFSGHLLFLLVHPTPSWPFALALSLLANAATVVLSVSLIRWGLDNEDGRTFGAGIGYMLLWVCLRYADLFGEAGGMLGAALLFALCAGVLFSVALYWRKRKGAPHAQSHS